MSNTKDLVEKLSSLIDDYDKIDAYCHDKALKSFSEKLPEPVIAKWGFQKFSSSDCEKLAQGNLKLSNYKPATFSESEPQKPRFPILSVIAVVFGVLSILMLALLISNYVALGKIDEFDYEEIKTAEYIIDNIWSGLVVFFLATIGISVFSIIKKKGIIVYISELKNFSLATQNYQLRQKQHTENQAKKRQRYNQEVKEEYAQYKDRYALYLQRREEHCANQKVRKQELAVQYADIVKRIFTYEGVPQKYKKPLNVEFADIDDTVEFYNETVAPLRYEIDSLIEIINDGRADTLKEAINCFVVDEARREQLEAEEYHRRTMERKAELQRMSQEQAQKAQLEALKATAKAPLQAQLAALKAQKQQLEIQQRNCATMKEGMSIANQISALDRQISDLERQIRWL